MSTKRKATAKFAAVAVNPTTKIPTKLTINETSTAVSNSGYTQDIETIEISSDEESPDDASDEEEGSDAEKESPGSDAEITEPTEHLVEEPKKTIVRANGASQSPIPDNKDDDMADGDGERSFGELLLGKETVDVAAMLSHPGDKTTALSQSQSRTALTVPSLSTLSTVLAQALRTDDNDLLESCLQQSEPRAIRETLVRLDSGLAGRFINKLAGRLHRRPGRAGSLMVWIQWTLVAHGGALASQPDVVKELSALQKVLAERARGLNSLLVLKGKLDLLESQMQLRQGNRRRERHGGSRPAIEDQDDEADLVWAEGDADGIDVTMINGTSASRNQMVIDEDEIGMLPATNGIMGESDEEDDEDEDEESEAEEDDIDEDEVDHEDLDEDENGSEEEDSDEDAAPPAKVQKVAPSFPSRR
jgi:U3 small nucleolar RNA-associated protein 5